MGKLPFQTVVTVNQAFRNRVLRCTKILVFIQALYPQMQQFEASVISSGLIHLTEISLIRVITKWNCASFTDPAPSGTSACSLNLRSPFRDHLDFTSGITTNREQNNFKIICQINLQFTMLFLDQSWLPSSSRRPDL